MYDIDDIMFNNPRLTHVREELKEKPMASDKVVKKKEDIRKSTNTRRGIGLDVGTGFLVGAGWKNNKIDFTPLRDAFFIIDSALFNQQMFNKGEMKYVEINNKINVVGDDAMTLATIQNTIAKRPLSHGVINPKERDAAPILREMFKHCVNSYKNIDNETLVFSVPGPKIGDENFDIEYHSMSIQSLARSLGFNPHPLNEAYAVVISELEKAKNVTGLGFSFGAGLVNVAFVYKSLLLFEFSIDRSGDYIDKYAAQACGINESAINHIKENVLDLSLDEFSVTPEERALMFTYKYVIKNTIKEVIRSFEESKKVNVIEPIPIIVSGGTTLPKGFLELFREECKNSKLPFKYTEILPAKNRLASVAKGCLLFAENIEKDNQS